MTGPSGRVQGDAAFVTLVTNADFALGARALVRSLRLSGTTADIVVMHTAGVPASALAPLAAFDVRLVPVDLLPTSDAFNHAHAKSALHDRAPFTKGQKPPFTRRWTISPSCACGNWTMRGSCSWTRTRWSCRT